MLVLIKDNNFEYLSKKYNRFLFFKENSFFFIIDDGKSKV